MLLNINRMFYDFNIATVMLFTPTPTLLSLMSFPVFKFTFLTNKYTLTIKALFIYHVDNM